MSSADMSSTPHSPRMHGVANTLYVLALAAAVVELFFRPFLFGPVGLLLALTATVMNAGDKRLGRIAVAAVGVCWLIGASITIWYSNPLY
jgi:hypothetical protein